MEIEMQPVESSQFTHVGYDPATEKLHIQFAKSKYEYDDVPQKLHETLMNAASKGSYFINNIKGKFAYRKLT